MFRKSLFWNKPVHQFISHAASAGQILAKNYGYASETRQKVPFLTSNFRYFLDKQRRPINPTVNAHRQSFNSSFYARPHITAQKR